MYPELFTIGGVTLYSYGLCILVGVIFAYMFYAKHSKLYGMNKDQLSEMFLWCIFGVFVGGKLFFFLEKPAHYLEHPDDFFDNMGSGFVFYGSFLFTVPILVWWYRKHKFPVWDMVDLLGLGGAMVHACGKIGCFMAGCCHGVQCSPRWGVVFDHPKTHADPAGVPLYPVQLWDAGIVFAVILFLLWLLPRKQFAGQIFLIYGMWYAVGRFATENFRGDEERGFLFNGLLTHSQFIAIIVFTLCLGLYYWRYKLSRKAVTA